MMILISSEKMKEHFEAYGEILEVVRGNCMKGVWAMLGLEGAGSVHCWVCRFLVCFQAYCL